MHYCERYDVGAPSKLACSNRWKSGPGRALQTPGSDCWVVEGDDPCEAYTAIAWGGCNEPRKIVRLLRTRPSTAPKAYGCLA